MHEPAAFDLDAYLARIGYAGPRGASFELLTKLHARHASSIPFENVDVRLGRPIMLDLASLQAKLVGARRGGYCFEQNTLFAAALRELGFEVATLEARVRPPGATAVLPRTHMTLRVRIDGVDWLADVGFGGDGPVWPVPLAGEVAEQPLGAYCVVAEGEVRVLRLRRGRIWHDLYAFGHEPALPIDYEVANHFTATHPSSIFVRALTVQLSTPEVRHALRGRTYTLRRREEAEERQLGDEEIVQLVREQIGLAVSEEDLLRALGDA